MNVRAVIDRGIGETRVAVYERRKLVELYVRRWSDKNLPRIGDIFAGRISAIDKSMGGAFVSLGAGPDGLLKFTNAPGAPRLTEGQMIKIEIKRESISEKGPVLGFIDLSQMNEPGPLVQISIEDFLKRRFGPEIKFEEAPVNYAEDVIVTLIALPGGGDIAIEPTRALIAIDVDKGSAQSAFDAAKAATTVIAHQIRLRGLGGLIAIDFPNLRQPKQRAALEIAMQEAISNDPNPIKTAPLSRFGVMEMTRAVNSRSLDEVFMPDGHNLSVETSAMMALKRLQREALTCPGAKMTLQIPDAVYAWLDQDDIGWRNAMQQKIGARFKICKGDTMHVSSDR